MGIISFSIPSDLVFTFSKKYDIKNFVETGTFKGNSSVWASNHFKNVYTIEIDETIYNETKNRSDAGNNIEFILGNSKDEIPKVIEKLDGPAIFWLDGHWCVGAVSGACLAGGQSDPRGHASVRPRGVGAYPRHSGHHVAGYFCVKESLFRRRSGRTKSCESGCGLSAGCTRGCSWCLAFRGC